MQDYYFRMKKTMNMLQISIQLVNNWIKSILENNFNKMLLLHSN